MCVGSDAVDSNGRQGRGEQEERGERAIVEEEEEEQLAMMDTPPLPPLWPPAAATDEGYEADTGSDSEIDVRMGYLQISDDPTNLPSIESMDDEQGGVMNARSSPFGNGGFNSLPASEPMEDDREEASPRASSSPVENGGQSGQAGPMPVWNPMSVTVNGTVLEFQVYGNVSTAHLLGGLHHREEVGDVAIPDSEEEEEEERRRAAEERAIAEANEADAARRAAPIPPERRSRIVDAMKEIKFGGQRPAWADFVPEDQWMNKIRQL